MTATEFGMSLCKTAEELVDGRAMSARFVELGNIDFAICHEDAAVGRDHVNVVTFHLDQTGHLPDGHLCVGLQKFRQVTFMFRMQVGDDHVSHARIARQDIEEGLQCLQATRRRANPNNG